MDNNFDNTPDNNHDQEAKKPTYTDPNAELYNKADTENAEEKNAGQQQYTYQQAPYAGQQQYTYQQGPQPGQQEYNYQQQQYTYQQGPQSGQQEYSYQQNQYTSQQDSQYQNTNYQQQYQQQYQDNYNYNVGNNTGYQQPYGGGMDTTPLSLGDCILMIILLGIPCVNIILAFVWAFSKSGNLNRRNYCRAYLIIVGVIAVLYLILAVVFGIAIGANSYYY